MRLLSERLQSHPWTTYSSSRAQQGPLFRAELCSLKRCFCGEAGWHPLQDRLLDFYVALVLRLATMLPTPSADQGSGGAFEISQRMTAMIGWGATTDFKDKWVYDQAADQYVMDQEMADRLRR